jgi:hypothetical protein
MQQDQINTTEIQNQVRAVEQIADICSDDSGSS